jgi:hypothetical protein
MSVYPLQFGHALGDVIDSETYEQVSGRIFGEGRLEVRVPAAFSAAAAGLGGDAAVVAAVQASVGKAFAEAVRAAVDAEPLKQALRRVPEINAAAIAKINAELRAVGGVFAVGSWSVKLDDEALARLQAAERALKAERQAKAAQHAAQPGAAAPGPVAAGTPVSVTWSDGRSYPATVRGFNGTHYEIAWDGGSGGAWVPAAAVRAR